MADDMTADDLYSLTRRLMIKEVSKYTTVSVDPEAHWMERREAGHMAQAMRQAMRLLDSAYLALEKEARPWLRK